MKTSSIRKHLSYAGAAVALCGLALAARAQYSNMVMSLNPILYYHLNDTTPVPGSLWTNVGTAGLVGTLFGLNAPFFQEPGALPAEPNSYAAGFDGISMCAIVPYSRAIDPSKGNPQAPFTVEGWFNPDTGAPPAAGAVVSCVDMGTAPNGWILFQDATVGWRWNLYANAVSVAQVSSGSNNLPEGGIFYHLALVWDGTNASMYTNGVAVAPPTPVPLFMPEGPSWFTSIGIMYSNSAFAFPWGGNAQEVAFYTNALSASNILAHYKNGTNASPTQPYEGLVMALNPLLYYRLGDPAYTDPTPGVLPPPFQPGQPLAENLGSLGTNYDATYEAGTVAGVPGLPYPGFGTNSHAVEFDGVADTVDFSGLAIPPLQTVTNANNFTFTCWFYNNSLQNRNGESPSFIGDALWWQWNGSSDSSGLWFDQMSGLGLMWDNNYFESPLTPGSETNAVFPEVPVSDWSFLAAVYTPASVTIYVNDVSYSISGVNAPRNFSLDPITVGTYYSGGVVNGLMQEVAMFTNALTAAQIQSLYNAAQVPPQIFSLTYTPPPAEDYEGQTVTFSAWTSGTILEWLHNGLPLTNQTGTNLVLTNVQTNNSGNYAVVVTGTYGTVTSSVVTLDVLTGPPVIVQQPTPETTLYVGGGATFTVSALGNLPLSYQWQFNGAPISGATNTSLTLAVLVPTNSGSYNVVITNSLGTNTSSNAVVTVIGVSTNAHYVSAMVSLGPTDYWQMNETSGSNAYDYIGGNTGIIAGGSGGITVGVPGAGYPGLEAGNTAYEFNGNGWVATPVLISGTEGTFTALVNVTPGAPLSLPGIMMARIGTSGSGVESGLGLYYAGSGNGDLYYNWGNASDTWGWSLPASGQGLSCGTGVWCFVVLSVGQNQTVIYVDNGSGSGLLSETNYVASSPVVANGPLLIGKETTASAFAGEIQEAAYFNRALSAAEVTALDHALFSSAPFGAPQILFQPVSQSVPLGTAASFTVTVVGDLPLTYQWQLNSNTIPGATGQTLVIPSVEATNVGYYQVTVSNAIGVALSQPARLVTMTGPPLIIQQPTPETTLYAGVSATFTVLAFGTLPLSYQWQYNDTPISGATNSSLTLTGLLFTNSGNYNVVITNSLGTNTSSNAVLTVIGVSTNAHYASAMVSLLPSNYWRLNETSGMNAYDYVGGMTGTIAGSAGGITVGVPGAGYPGLEAGNTAYEFNGSGWVATPVLISGTEGTFTALVNVTPGASQYLPGIMMARIPPLNTGLESGFGLYYAGAGNGDVYYTWNNASDTWGWTLPASGAGLSCGTGVWCFVVLSVGQDQTVIYVDNGSGLLSETNEVPSQNAVANGPLLIGDEVTAYALKGDIDEAAYFNRALSPAEVTALDHALFSSAPFGAPEIVVPPASQSVVPGAAASFTVRAVGDVPLSYQWQLNSNNIPGATGQTLVIPSVEATNVGYYQVTVSNSTGVVVSQPAQLVVLAFTFTRSGSTLTLNWPEGTLLSATNLAGPWTSVVGASPPSSQVTMTNGQEMFFRILW
jgi:hypothetical protein